MPSFKTAFPSKFFKAEDVSNKPSLTIKAVGFEDVGQGSDTKRKLVISFAEREQRLVLNVTNANTIAELLGTEDYDKWAGQRVKLVPSTTHYQGRLTSCVRIDRPDVAPAATLESEVGF